MKQLAGQITVKRLQGTLKTAVQAIGQGGAAAPLLQEKAVTITENGRVEVTPDSGYDGLSKAVVTADVPAPAPVLQEKTIIKNGEYTADEGYDGMSKVIVDVPGGVAQDYDGTISITGEAVEDYDGTIIIE